MKKVFILPVGILMLAATAGAAKHPRQIAAVDNDVNETIPSAVATVNPCNGDAVALTGEIHLLGHSNTSTSGIEHYYLSSNARYSGTGAPSLVNYQGSIDDMLEFTIGSGSATTETVHQDMTLNSQTGADNYHMSFKLHVTFRPDGTPTAEVSDVETRCNG
jgi:hypothetical protein